MVQPWRRRREDTHFGFPLFLFFLPPLPLLLFAQPATTPVFPLSSPFFCPNFETLEAKEEEEEDLHLWGIPSAGAGFSRIHTYVRRRIASGNERSEDFSMGIWETATTKVDEIR